MKITDPNGASVRAAKVGDSLLLRFEISDNFSKSIQLPSGPSFNEFIDSASGINGVCVLCIEKERIEFESQGPSEIIPTLQLSVLYSIYTALFRKSDLSSPKPYLNS